MDLATLKTAIYTWMARETGLTVIFANQGKPRPKFPYGTIWIPNAGIRQGAFDEVRLDDDTEEFAVHGVRTTTVVLNIYGPNANDLMSRLRDSLDQPAVIEEFALSGIAHIGENGPNDLTAFEDTQNVERSQFDLQVSYGIERAPSEETPIYPIEEVEITHEDSPQGDVTLTVGDAE